MCPKVADGMANSIDPSSKIWICTICQDMDLGLLWYSIGVCHEKPSSGLKELKGAKDVRYETKSISNSQPKDGEMFISSYVLHMPFSTRPTMSYELLPVKTS